MDPFPVLFGFFAITLKKPFAPPCISENGSGIVRGGPELPVPKNVGDLGGAISRRVLEIAWGYGTFLESSNQDLEDHVFKLSKFDNS